MPSGLITKIWINAALIMITIITGFLLHKSGKPYGDLLFNLHKFATIGLIVLIVMIIVAYAKNFGMKGFVLVLVSVGIISTIGLLVSGGAMSLDKNQDIMLLVHRISSAVFVVCVGLLFYTFARA